MTVVTISRQFGCGGSEVGRAVAQALGARYVDRALIVEAARRIGVPEDIVSEMDERIHDLTERFIEDISLAFTGRQSVPVVQHAPHQSLTDVQLLTVTRSIIEEVAAAGNAVVVGRGAQMILRGHKDALHVHLVAPLSARVESVSRSMNLTQVEAKRLIQRQDAERAGYLRRYYNGDWSDPLLYHLVLNTGLLGQDASVQIIVFRATMLDVSQHQIPSLPVDEDAQRLLSSLQAARDSVRSIVDRYRHRA
ncbi:MAG: cytidylate kinase-like family protein [Chloroflexota bacterium]